MGNVLLQTQLRRPMVCLFLSVLLCRKTITGLLRSQYVTIDGKEKPLAAVSNSFDSWFDRLKGKEGKGFSFDRNRSILEYVDDQMKGMNLVKSCLDNCSNSGANTCTKPQSYGRGAFIRSKPNSYYCTLVDSE